jgi:hypothetical protein
MRDFNMFKATSKRVKIVLALSVMFVLSSFAPVGAGGNDGEVVLVDYAVEGNAVYVTVKNTSKKAKTVEVHVYGTVGGVQVKGYTPVAVFGRGTASTLVAFTAPVDGVVLVGIIDSDSPI